MILKHGEAIEADYRQRLMESTKLAGESREGIREAYEVLKREIEHVIKGLRDGMIFSSTFIGAVAGGVIGVIVLIFFLYPSTDITPPPAPILLSPTNRDTVSDNTPTFAWIEISDASGVTYTIQVSSSRDFADTVINRSGRTASTFTHQSPLPEGKYFWRVQAVDGAGNKGPFSEVFTFTLKIVSPVDITPPPTSILLSPTNRDTVSDNTPTFAWIDVSDASGVTYTIQISINKDFADTVINRSGRTASTFTPQSPLPDGKYFWRVQAVDGAGNKGPFSEVFTFTLTSTP
ncbi:MAG: Ig-like domain-containing protein [Nitrososphaerales archaeon]